MKNITILSEDIPYIISINSYILILESEGVSMSRYIYQIDNFPLDNNNLLLNETLFHNANGYIGVRASFEEGYLDGYDSIRGQYINGFYDYVAMPQAEKLYGLFEEKQAMLNVADTQGIILKIDGEEFSLFDGEIISSSRKLDMRRGITIREVTWQSPGGKEVHIRIKRMTSFEILPLFLIEYMVVPLNFSGEIEILSTHIGEVMNYCNPNDPRVAGESFKHLLAKEQACEDGASYITMKTSKSDLTVCTAVRSRVTKTSVNELVLNDFKGQQTFKLEVKQGEKITLYKESIFCDSIRYEEPRRAAQAVLARIDELLGGAPLPQGASLDFTPLYRAQEKYLDSFWHDCDMGVVGDEELNNAICYNLYQLVQSVGKDPHCNIAAKGLSGEGYEGHYFWDTEMYLQPFYTLTANSISKNLIRYRYNSLNHARDNARIMGHEQGALYPWRTIMGKECSGYYVSGSAAYHINGAVAYAVVAYYLATKDMALMRECGAEILIETARLWISVGNYYKGQFHIHEVTGPDEYTCLVSNNYYTNAIAKYNLTWAAKMVEILRNEEHPLLSRLNISDNEVQEFREAARAMYLPYNEELGINPQDDSFLQKAIMDISMIPKEKKPLLLHYHPMFLYRHQICKQADTVLAHFILEDEQDIETIRKSFEYYEKVTTHDSSLSTCIFSIIAAKLGEQEKAYEYFGESAKLDLYNTHQNTKDGIHTANMGGTYMAIVYGFGGLRLKESGLYLQPIMPKEWEGYHFCIRYEEAQIKVEVKKEYCTIELLEGSPVNIYVYEKQYQVTKDKIRIDRGMKNEIYRNYF